MSLHRPSKNARLMTAHSSAAILRLSLLSAQTSDLQSGKVHTCPPPGQVRSVGKGNNKAVSVEPSAPQPPPPMLSIVLRPWET